MRQIQSNGQSYVWLILRRLTLARSSNPPVLQIVLLVAEALVYTYYIASDYRPATQLTLHQYPIPVMIALIVVLLIRYLLNATLSRLTFLPALFTVFAGNNVENTVGQAIKAVILVFCIINCGVQILANIQYEFMTQNPYSQSLNHCKFLHAIILLVGTLLRQKQIQFFGDRKFIGQVVMFVLFLCLIIIKLLSTCQNQWTKQIQLRFYFLGLAYYCRNVVIFWENSLASNYQHLIVIVFSQVVYFFVDHKFGQLQVDIQISKNNICHLVFSIMSYQYSLIYDEKKQKAVQQLNPQRILNNSVGKSQVKKRLTDQQIPVNSAIPEYQEQLQQQKTGKNGFIAQIMDVSKSNKRTAIRVQHLLRQAIQQKTDSLFRLRFLIAQLKLNIFGSMISAKKIVAMLNHQLNAFCWIDRICLWKFQQRLYDQVQKKYQLNTVSRFQQFLQNQSIRTLIIKNSYDYLALWKYLMNNDFLFKKLSRLINRVLQRKYQVTKAYNKLQVKCSTTILLYISYLYNVRRDYNQTLKVCRSFEIYQQSHHMLHVQNKIYVNISLQNNDLKFQNISYNVKKLLGYQRSAIRGAPISIFLPQFFKQSHQKMIDTQINFNNSSLYLMRKTVIARHSNGHYLLGGIQTKMVHGQDGCLFMQGYIQMKSDQSYKWKNYFIAKMPEGQLIDMGRKLQVRLNSNVIKGGFFMNQIFQDKSGSQNDLLKTTNNNDPKLQAPRKYFEYNDGTSTKQYVYQLIRTLTTTDLKFQYYVCRRGIMMQNDSDDSSQNQNQQRQKVMQSAKKISAFSKFQVDKFEDNKTKKQSNLQNYFNAKQQLIKKMALKSTLIILCIVIVIQMAIFSFNVILTARVSYSRKQNLRILNDMQNLSQFYHSIQNLGMMANQISVKSNLGINYNYSYYNMTQLCLSIQRVNQKLSKFDRNKYGQQGTIAINYPKPLHDVVLDFTVNYFVRIYTGGDVDLNRIAQNDAHYFFKYVYAYGLQDYLKVFNQQNISYNNLQNRLKIALGISLLILVVIMYFLVIRIDQIKRDYQYQTLNLISQISVTHMFVKNIDEYLQKIIGGVNQKQFQSDYWNIDSINNLSKFNNSGYDPNVSGFNQTSRFSSRQNTGRQFINDNNLSLTQRQYRNGGTLGFSTLQKKQKADMDQNLKRQQKIKPISKKFLFVWSFIILVILFICIIWFILDQKGNQIQLPKSISTLLMILNRQILFNSQIITYLDFLSFNSTSELYDLNKQKFNLINDQTYSFQQTKYDQFKNFTQMLQKVTYVYICQYMSCSTTYKDYINIIYNSAIHKLTNYMQNSKNRTFLVAKSFQMQALWYSSYIMQSTINQLLLTYIQNYKSFDNNKSSSDNLFYYCQMSAVISSFFYVLYLYFWDFLGSRKKFFRILDLVKKQSYNTKQVPKNNNINGNN